MPLNTILLFVVLVVLIFLSAFFSSSETALMSINRYRLKSLIAQGNRRAIIIDKLLQNRSKLLGTILLGNNLVNMAAASVTTVLAINLFGENAIAVATILITIIILIFAEVPPKTFASLNPEKIAFIAAYPLNMIQIIATPLVILISKTSDIVLNLFKDSNSKGNEGDLSLEELRHLVVDGARLIPSRHREMLLRIMDLEYMTVSDIMVPRNQIELLNIEDDWENIVDELATSHHGHIPIYRDNVNNIIGIASTRKTLQLIRNNDFDKDDFEKTLKAPYFVPENASINLQLALMQREKQRTAIVVDEYGDLQGLVTLEEILEEVIGDYSDIIPGMKATVQKNRDGSYIVPGTMSVRELNRKLKWQLPYLEHVKTLNGLILETYGSIPESGEKVIINDYQIQVLKTNDKGIDTLKIKHATNASGQNAYDEAVES